MDTDAKQTVTESVYKNTCVGYGAKSIFVKNQRQIDTDLEKSES